MLRKLGFRLTLAAGLVAAVTLSGPMVSGAAQERLVEVRDFQFGDGTPGGNTVTIEAGDSVRWTAFSGIHKVVSDGPPFFSGSGTLDANDSTNNTYAVTFDTLGDYAYHCDLHPQQMTGVIKVVEPAPPPPTTTSTTAPPTTTTTRPPTTTTTAHGATPSTTAPPTTPTTAGPAPTTTTTPATVAAARPTLTSPTTAGPGPPPTTTTGKSKDKPGKTAGPTTTTGKHPKGDGKGDKGSPPPAAPGDQPAPDAIGGDLPALESGEVPGAGSESQDAASETGGGEQAARIAEHDQPRDRHGIRLLLGTGVVVTLLGLGALGYKWRTRDSQYWAA